MPTTRGTVFQMVFDAILWFMFGTRGTSETREEAARWLMQREVRFVYQPAIIVEFKDKAA